MVLCLFHSIIFFTLQFYTNVIHLISILDLVEMFMQIFLFQLNEALQKCLALRRFADAWMYCTCLNEPAKWNELGKAVLHCMEIEFGECAHVQVKDNLKRNYDCESR